MKQKHLYLILAVMGFIGPYYFFISFLMAYGLDAKVFMQQLFDTQISSFFAIDLIVASVVFLIYLSQEARSCSLRRRWLCVIALLTVGLSFALPLFLYIREDGLRAQSTGQV